MLSAHYETVATAFQVVDIATPLRARVSPDDTVLDAVVEINANAESSDDEFCLIRDEHKIYGYIAIDFIFDEAAEKLDGPSNGRAGDYCTPITADQIVAGSLPLLDLIPLFRQRHFFCVLTRNDITHLVSFSDLDKLPVKLCLFALITALESELIGVFTDPGRNTRDYLRHLSVDRIQKARHLCKVKYSQRPERRNLNQPDGYNDQQILLCTTFSDKVTILLNSPHPPFANIPDLKPFFDRAHDLRNRIAHSDSILSVLKTPLEFDQFTRA